ncbi:hypothetical protein BH09BAC6_BH09BAC6_02840 [soil metagenome]|jgi:hypothetical protein
MNFTHAQFILLGFGIVFTVFGIVKYRVREKLFKRGIRVKGLIVEIEAVVDSTINTSYYPVVQFNTLENESLRERYNLGFNPSAYKQGDTVNIIYNTENPKQFIIDDKDTRVIGPVLIGIGLAIIAGVLIYQLLL